MPPLLESEIKKQIRDYLELTGWFVVNIFQTLGCHRGIADLYVIKNGINVWVEVKTEKGNQTAEQKVFESNIKASGGRYFVIRSLDEIIKLTKEVLL